MIFTGQKIYTGRIPLVIFILLCAVILAGCGTKEITPATQPAAEQKISTEEKKEISVSAESETLFKQAEEAYQAGNNESALRLADEAIAKDGNNYKACSLRGLLLAFDGKPEAAVKQIQKALAICPSYVQGFYDMAMAKKLAGQYDDSIRYFKKVLDADPKNVWCLYGIATCYADKKDKEDALLYLKQAADIGGEAVKDAARPQDHFAWLHEDEDFQQILR